MRLNRNCIFRKQITLTTRQFELESNGFKIQLKKSIEGTEMICKKILITVVNVASPGIGMSFDAKTGKL